MSLYLATDGPNWKNQWDLAQTIDKWYGIELGPDGCVRTIDLDGDPQFSLQRKNGNGLKGQLPDLILPSLRNLLLASNQLTGSIPDFSGMPFLRVLQLSCNKFNGVIPNFSKVPNLKAVELDYNQLQGTVPDFQHTPNVESLYLLNNQLRGSIPDFKQAPKLKYFIASNNRLSGNLPDFRHNADLRKLLIKNNQISGTLPDLGHLADLTHVDLSDNQLEGELFDWQFCPELRYIQFENNQLTGAVPEIQHLLDLEILILANNQLTGALPDPSHLTRLHTYVVNNNHFTALPVFQNTTALQLIAVNHNHLHFQHILPNHPEAEIIFHYDRQSSSLADSLLISQPDSSVVLSAGLEKPLAELTYTWYRDGKVLDKVPSANELLIERINQGDIGAYHCEMRHPELPDLVLTSPTTRLLVQDGENLYESPVFAVEDVFTFDACQPMQEFNILANDFVNDPLQWSVELLASPELGILEEIGHGQFRFTVPEGFEGVLGFEYQICSLEESDNCSETYVELIVSQKKCQEDPELFIPSAISPNNDGLNDVFYISKLEEAPADYQNNELVVFDVQGRQVFYAKPYRNDWNGRFQHSGQQLPSGVYFYQFNTGIAHQKIKSGSLMIMQ
ncbi:MAG: gliding motility-associated C-terminal domain-containing protein [Bacteroidota bacterium]